MIRNSLLMAVASQTGYQIPYSLRFRASNNANLSRTPGSASNRRTFTWSSWVKRGLLAATRTLFFAGATSQTTGAFFITFTSSDQIQITIWDGGAASKITSAVFRDPSAWYNIVVAVDTTNAIAGNRVRLYINGVEITSFGTNVNPSLNLDTQVNNTSDHRFGVARDSVGTLESYFDGHITEVNFIDGQVLSPTSFGETDPTTGVWVPKEYSGTYGTNGFYLPFSNAASTTTIGNDSSGNGNNWTSSGISVTSGVTFDQLTDTPTNNFCTWNPLKQSGSGLATLSSANLNATGSAGTSAIGTFGMSSGKWYWEIVYSTLGTTPDIGIIQLPGTDTYPAGQKHYVYRSDGNKRSDGPGPVAYGASWTSGDVMGIAFDADAGSITFYKNNVSQGVAFSGISSSEYPFFAFSSYNASTSQINFGQRPFAYTPPTGFVALCTANLPTPTIQNGASAFQATLRTGTGASASVSSLAFQPDLVWIKSRSNATNHNLFDAVRGVNNGLVSNTADAEYADANSLTAFNSNGYTLGTDGSSRGVNINTNTYVDWAWREGAAYGLDIVSYTGDAVSGRTVSHNLNAVPHMMILKSRSLGTNWYVYHRNLTSAAYQLYLNLTNAQDNSVTTAFNSVAPTSSVFTLPGTGFGSNNNSATYVNYLFTSIPGFSLFGSYTGNGSADGPFVWCGFRPRFILLKRTDSTGQWVLHDTARDTFNVVDDLLNITATIETTFTALDITANGFKLRNTDSGYNASGGTYIFAAFAETPFKYATAR